MPSPRSGRQRTHRRGGSTARRQHKEVEAETNAALTRVLASGEYVLGAEVAAFESEWASYCGVRRAVTVNSGTDALALALIASGAVRPGRQDKVITSPLTAGYTALAIMSAGGVPVFADIDPLTYTIDPESARQAITPRTRAIVPVHIYGRMASSTAAVISRIPANHKKFFPGPIGMRSLQAAFESGMMNTGSSTVSKATEPPSNPARAGGGLS